MWYYHKILGIVCTKRITNELLRGMKKTKEIINTIRKTNEWKTLFSKFNGRFNIGGDFNAQHIEWGSRLIKPKGRKLYKAVIDYGCEFVSRGKPTMLIKLQI